MLDIGVLGGSLWAVNRWFGRLLAVYKGLGIVDFFEAIGMLGGCWWAVNQWFGIFLTTDKILDMLDILCYGGPDMEFIGITPLGQAHSVREAPEKVEGVAKAILFEWKITAFTAFEFTYKLMKS